MTFKSEWRRRALAAEQKNAIREMKDASEKEWAKQMSAITSVGNLLSQTPTPEQRFIADLAEVYPAIVAPKPSGAVYQVSISTSLSQYRVNDIHKAAEYIRHQNEQEEGINLTAQFQANPAEWVEGFEAAEALRAEEAGE